MLARMDAFEARVHHGFACGATRDDRRDDLGGGQFIERFDGPASSPNSAFTRVFDALRGVIQSSWLCRTLDFSCATGR
jgi:hypothetical protein